MPQQSVLSNGHVWSIQLSKKWDILGPFPIHAREQHYLSPSFPLNLSEPIDWNKEWPSSYADQGKVSWSTAESNPDDTLNVSFPKIRWKELRALEGWAALQHHAILRTTLTLYPPSTSVHAPPPRLLVNLIRGTFFTILPSGPGERRSFVPQWHAGNVYDMERALPRAVELPTLPNLRKPTVYEVFISSDYEIRLFGDPIKIHGSDNPIHTIRFVAELETPLETLIHEPSQDVISDFVDGKAFGDAFGIAFRSVSGWWTVKNVRVCNTKAVTLSTFERDTVIAPTQTRIVPLSLHQTNLFLLSNLDVSLEVVSRGGTQETIAVSLAVHHLHRWNQSSYETIKGTYFYSRSMPTAFLAIPPLLSNSDKMHPPILALHGAGVDIFAQPFWTQSIPRNKHSWLIFPTGRTSWGLDWHGPSAQDAWTTVDSLVTILQRNKDWERWEIKPNPRVVLMGHSNGGQGAWYLASRYPDRVAGVIPAAAYIKSQAYVPWTMSRSAHYLDPALRAILDSSLTPDDNDLHLSNLVDIPVLAVHGGSDTNVPTWHSREYVSILKTLGSGNVSLREVASEDHWFATVFDNEEVKAFLEAISEAEPRSPKREGDFTLTVSDPAVSGTLNGWKIESLLFPGRLGRLRVSIDMSGFAQIVTSNVHSFSLDRRQSSCRSIQISGPARPVLHLEAFDTVVRFITDEADSGIWEMADTQQKPILLQPQAPARLQSILSSDGPIVFVVSNDEIHSWEYSLALRLAHDLQTYHRLDTEIMSESKAQACLGDTTLPSGNVVFIGEESSVFPQKLLADKKTPFTAEGAVLELNGQILDDPRTGSIFLHPHPVRTDGVVLFMLSKRHETLERLARLFPIRTGVAGPSWVVTGPPSDSLGAGGIHGAGTWTKSWGWNEALSMWIW